MKTNQPAHYHGHPDLYQRYATIINQLAANMFSQHMLKPFAFVQTAALQSFSVIWWEFFSWLEIVTFPFLLTFPHLSSLPSLLGAFA